MEVTLDGPVHDLTLPGKVEGDRYIIALPKGSVTIIEMWPP